MPDISESVRKKHPMGTPALPTAEMTEMRSHSRMVPRVSVVPPFCITKSEVTRMKAAQPFMLIVVREFGLTLNAGNCVSNEVLVAVGCDADGDGDLSFDETAFVFGCDCGERYLVDYVSGTVDDTVGETVVVGWRSLDPAWNMAKVVKRGAGTVGEMIVETVLNKRFDITIR